MSMLSWELPSAYFVEGHPPNVDSCFETFQNSFLYLECRPALFSLDVCARGLIFLQLIYCLLQSDVHASNFWVSLLYMQANFFLLALCDFSGKCVLHTMGYPGPPS